MPDRATVCGLFMALSVSVSVADLAPNAVGVKAIPMAQDLFTPSIAPQVVADSEKSPPFVAVTLERMAALGLKPELVDD